MKRYIEKEADVLVVGGGLAGLWAAIRASDFARNVVLVEKGKVARSGVSVFCHTTGAPVPASQHEEWLAEQVDRSAYLASQYLVDVYLRENGDRIKDMISWGVEFEKNADGSLRTEGVRGQKVTRSALYTGRLMMEKMRAEALRRGVVFEERVMVTDLLTSDGRLPTAGVVTGAAGLCTRTAELVVYSARSIVLASGSMGTRTYVLYTNALSGDGQAMAFRAGAELVNMEMAVSQAFGIWNKKFATGGQQQFLMNNSRIVNRLGERVMERYTAAAKAHNPEYDGHVEFGDICRAIAIENLEGRGPCYFDLSGWSEENVAKMRKVLPTTMAAFDKDGIDIRRDKIESTTLTATYCTSQQAGLKVNPQFATTVPGLYAAGVTVFAGAGVSPQGFCNVSGYRAGENAARRASEVEAAPLVKKQVENIKERMSGWLAKGSGNTPDSLFAALNRMVLPYGASFFKNRERIISTLKDLENLEKEDLRGASAGDAHGLVKLNELRNIITVLKIIYSSALERRESRFGHYREEYPFRDDVNWLKWTVARNDGSGGVSITTEAVPFDNYPVKPRQRLVIPSSTKYSVRQ